MVKNASAQTYLGLRHSASSVKVSKLELGGRGWYKLKVKPTWERMSKLKHNLDLDILRQVSEYQSYSWGGGGRGWYKLKVKPTWERISKLKLNLDVKVPKLELYFKFGPSSITTTPAVALVLCYSYI